MSVLRQWLKSLASHGARMVLEPLLARTLNAPVGGRIMPVSVHTLVSRRTWRMGVIAVSSFCWFSGRNWDVWIHDDGSLNEENKARLRRLRPAWHIVSRAESDARARERLAAFPRFLALRDRHPLAVKMADAWLSAPESHYVFIDSDCVVFRQPTFIIEWANARDDTCWFMEEYEEVYSYVLPPAELDEWAGKPVRPRVNTGVCLMCKNALQWSRIEQLLDAPQIRKLGPDEDWYIEQTLSAIVLTDWGRGGMLPAREYVTGYATPKMGWPPHCVACHYVGPTKYDRYYYHGLTGVLVRQMQACWGMGTRSDGQQAKIAK